ncbi:hypothetical protein NB620_10520 [Vibrio alginolyticus]|uniref:hypothetical protein n=1 Tax=Vibrio alginolyticus TaxID=663 RepID=UPI00215C15B8|nr:hypothetical protein [Vibrio alginolyticus]MCS0000698.1 hypothetical protein [Vibrio alginolyticus]
MSDNEAQDANAGKANKSQSSSAKPKVKLLVYVVGATLLVGGASLAAHKMGLIPDFGGPSKVEEIQKLERNLEREITALRQSLPELIKTEIDVITKSEEFGAITELQRQEIAQSIITKIDIPSKVKDEFGKQKSEIVKSTSKAASQKITQTISSTLQQQIDDSITMRLKPYHQFNSAQETFNVSLTNRLDKLESDVNSFEGEFAKLNNSLSNGHTKAARSNERKRLKEFNVVDEIAEGVFAVRAPDRSDNSPHYITLYKSEPFKSKIGNHKVTNIKGEGEDGVLLIGSKYFIDKERQEYTPTELANLRRSQLSKKKVVKPAKESITKPTAVQVAKTTTQHIGKNTEVNSKVVQPTMAIASSSTVVQPIEAPKMVVPSTGVTYKDGRILLPDYAMITKSQDLNSALVVNLTKTSGERTISVEKGKYYDFIGTVREISADGTICSDTYCIGALR